MPVTYKFKRAGAPGRFEAIHPDTNTVVGYVVGTSNNWNTERLDGTSLNNRFPTKQAAANHSFYQAPKKPETKPAAMPRAIPRL